MLACLMFHSKPLFKIAKQSFNIKFKNTAHNSNTGSRKMYACLSSIHSNVTATKLTLLNMSEFIKLNGFAYIVTNVKVILYMSSIDYL